MGKPRRKGGSSGRDRIGTILQSPGSAHTEEGSQNRPEIGPGDMEVVALAEIGSATQVSSPHGPGLKEVSEASFDSLTAFASREGSKRQGEAMNTGRRGATRGAS